MTKCPKPRVEYRDVAGFSGYRVGSDGSFWSQRALPIGLHYVGGWKKLRPFLNNTGYLGIKLSRIENGRSKRSTKMVHTIVLEAFISPRPTPCHEARHINGNRQDNRLSNLRWGTRSENQIDSVVHGTARCAKLTPKMVRKIRLRLHSGESASVIADDYQIGVSAIEKIENGVTWQWLK